MASCTEATSGPGSAPPLLGQKLIIGIPRHKRRPPDSPKQRSPVKEQISRESNLSLGPYGSASPGWCVQLKLGRSLSAGFRGGHGSKCADICVRGSSSFSAVRGGSSSLRALCFSCSTFPVAGGPEPPPSVLLHPAPPGCTIVRHPAPAGCRPGCSVNCTLSAPHFLPPKVSHASASLNCISETVLGILGLGGRILRPTISLGMGVKVCWGRTCTATKGSNLQGD